MSHVLSPPLTASTSEDGPPLFAPVGRAVYRPDHGGRDAPPEPRPDVGRRRLSFPREQRVRSDGCDQAAAEPEDCGPAKHVAAPGCARAAHVDPRNAACGYHVK